MHGTEEASNDEKVKVRIIHGLTLVIKKSYTYCKSLLALEAKYYYMPLGGYIGRKILSLVPDRHS